MSDRIKDRVANRLDDGVDPLQPDREPARWQAFNAGIWPIRKYRRYQSPIVVSRALWPDHFVRLVSLHSEITTCGSSFVIDNSSAPLPLRPWYSPWSTLLRPDPRTDTPLWNSVRSIQSSRSTRAC